MKNLEALSPRGQVPAWQVGAQAAQALREQENMNGVPVSNVRLAEMAGTSSQALEYNANVSDLTFAFDSEANRGRVVLRPRWATGRRFDLARLIGDRITLSSSDQLYPATRTYTYRQKLQRSFAAEFLCPFDALDSWLEGDYSSENQDDAAEYFDVSPLTVRTLLVNHNRIDRDELGRDYEATAVTEI